MIQLNDKWTGIKLFIKWPSATISLCHFFVVQFNSVFVPWIEKNSNAMTHSQTVNNLFPCYTERRRL